MLIYVCMYALFFVMFCYYTIVYGHKKQNKLMAWTGFVLITMVLGLRHPSMGVDLAYGTDFGYLGSFSKISTFSWIEILEMDEFKNYEKGYVILNKLLSVFCKDHQFLLFSCAALCVWPVAYRLAHNKEQDSLFSWLIYLGLPCFLMNYSGLRQALAIGWVFFAFKYIEERRFWKYCLCILLASTFHSTAIVCMVAYPIFHVKMQRNVRFLTILAFPVVYVFRYQIFMVLLRIMGKETELDYNGAVNLMLLFILIYIVCSILYSKDERYNGYLNIFFIACACQCMGGLYSTIMRIGYYFMMALPILLPITAKNFGNQRDEYIFKFGAGAGFTMFAWMSISAGSWALSNPYYFFWSKM